jgi:hypothetical protein
MFFKKKIKKELTEHQLSIATMYLSRVINDLEIELSVCDSINTGFDNWAVIHDIVCLKETIKYLE